MKKYFLTVIIIAVLIFTISCQQYEQTGDIVNIWNFSEEGISYTEIEKYTGGTHGGCSSENCIHFLVGNVGFHTFNMPIINHVGGEEFDEWMRNLIEICREQHDPDCGFCCINIIRLIREFNVTREEMEHLMRTTRMYYEDHDLDVIFSGDDGLIAWFYATPRFERENYSEFRLRAAELTIKIGLLDFANDFGTRNNYTGDNIRLFNIVEFVRRYNVPRDEFEALIETRVSRQDRYPEVEYNVDLIFSNDPRLNFMIAQGVDPAIIDRMYQTNDGIFRYALIYELTVEAVNAGREITIAEVNRAIELDRMAFTITTPGLEYNATLNAVVLNTIQISAAGIPPASVFVEVNRVFASGEKTYVTSNTVMFDANGVGIYSLASSPVTIAAGEHVEILVYTDNNRTRLVTQLVVHPVVFEF